MNHDIRLGGTRLVRDDQGILRGSFKCRHGTYHLTIFDDMAQLDFDNPELDEEIKAMLETYEGRLGG